MKKWNLLKLLISIFLIFILVVFAALCFLVGTYSGAKFTLDTVKDLVKDTVILDIDLKGGSFYRGLQTGKLYVEVKDIVKVSASSFDIAYDLIDVLVYKYLDVSKLKADDLDVVLLSSDKKEEPKIEEPLPEENNAPEKIAFPVTIQIHDLNVNNFHYGMDILDVNVDTFKTKSIGANNHLLYMVDTIASLPVVHLKDGASEKDREKIEKINEEVTKAINNSQSGDVQVLAFEEDSKAKEQQTEEIKEKGNAVSGFDDGNGLIEDFPTVNLPFDITLTNINFEKGRYYQSSFDTGLCDITLSAAWIDTKLYITQFDAFHELGTVSLTGNMNFTEHFPMSFKLSGQGALNDATEKNFGGALYGLQGSAEINGSLVDLKVNGHLINPDETVFYARANCLSSMLPLEAKVGSQYLSWPLYVEEPTAQVENLKLDAKGSLQEGIDIDFSGKLSGYGFDDFLAVFSGKSSLSDSHIDNLTLKGIYQGSQIDAHVSGDAHYQDTFGFKGNADIKSSDLGFVNEMLQGALSFVSDVDVAYDPQKQDLLINVDDLNADFHLNNQPSKLIGKEIYGTLNTGIEVKTVEFIQPDNTLQLTGVYGNQTHIQGKVNFKDLSYLYPTLKGEFIGNVNVTGENSDFDVAVNGKSNRLSSGDFNVRNLIFDANVDTASENIMLTAVADTLRFTKALKPSRQCIVDFNGNLDKHELVLNCGGDTSGFMSLAGNYDKESSRWHGSINEFFISNPLSGAISLQKPLVADINTAAMEGNVSAFNLSGDIGTIEVSPTVFGPNEVKSALKVASFKLESLQPFLPEGTAVRGTVAADAAVNIKNGVPDIKADIMSNRISAASQGALIILDKVDLNAKMTQNDLTLNALLNLLGDRGNIDASLKVSDPTGLKRLSGHLNLNNLDLSLFTAVGGAFNALEGTAGINGNFSGTLEKPLFNGNIKVKGKGEPRYDVGSIEDFDFNVISRGNRGDIAGFISLNEGKINLNGELDWSEAAKADLSITSNRLPLFLLGYGQAFADIDTKVTFDENLSVIGTVTIPEARISVKNIESSGVSVSGDEIIVGKNGASELMRQKASSPVNTYIDMKMRLGDNVKLKAMGLDGYLQGGIDILKTLEEQGIKASGQVHVVEGNIDLYGHHFVVGRAETRFNGDIANPSLNVEVYADRSALEDDVDVGIKVTGNASDPKIEFVSSPAMSDNEALSYILYGHGLEKDAGSQDSNSSLLLGLGLSSTTGIVNSLVGAFGIQDVQVGTAGSGENTQVAVQGYITRRIRVSYGYGVFNAIGEFKVRYEFMRKLYAEFASSIDQAVDLIYSFEFD